MSSSSSKSLLVLKRYRQMLRMSKHLMEPKRTSTIDRIKQEFRKYQVVESDEVRYTPFTPLSHLLNWHTHTHTQNIHTETSSSTNARNIFCFFECSFRNTSGVCFRTRSSVRAYVSYPERERLSRRPPWIRLIEVHPNSRVIGTKILKSFHDINVLHSVNILWIENDILLIYYYYSYYYYTYTYIIHNTLPTSTVLLRRITKSLPIFRVICISRVMHGKSWTYYARSIRFLSSLAKKFQISLTMCSKNLIMFSGIDMIRTR